MPSIVLLMRSRLRIRPFSFSTRMPSSSSYCRLIVRRPASSFGRSSCPSSPCCSSSSRRLNPLFLVLLPAAFSVFRARAIPPNPPSARPLAVAAALLAHPEEAAWPEPGELDDARFGATAWAAAAMCHLAALLRGLRLLLRHVRRRASGWGLQAEVQLRAHNTAFCRPCYLFFFRRQVERAIDAQRMLVAGERILVAVSGGKDSLALWDMLADLGHDTTGLYLGLGIGEYSDRSREKVEQFAAARGLPLRVVKLEDEQLAVPGVAAATRRAPCAACGTMKRHYFDAAAFAGGFDVLATGHNLDDEAARLLGNVLRWQKDHLARQRPVLPPSHPKFVRKVKPLYLTSEYETAVYAFMRGIDYIVDECPNAAGATQLLYKGALDRLEVASPGTKLAFVKEFLRSAQPAFAAVEQREPMECAGCGMPAYGVLCSFCSLVREVENRRARTSSALPA